MVVWFAVIGVLGAIQVAQNPHVLVGILPIYAFYFIIFHGGMSMLVLGAVVLAVTGAEALYADMGHFGARPIRLAWLAFVLPALVLNYFGQGALVMADTGAGANPFYLMAPEQLRLPLVVLATMATVIASQALISGAFSIARQCTQMGFLPRLTVRHTSQTEEGQIFVPQVNNMLMIGVLILVFSFKSSAALASAYGIAVTGTFICTCILATIVFRRQFGWPRWAAIAVWGGFFVIDSVFFSANALKIVEGGWVPLAIGGVLMMAMTTWKQGRDLMQQRWKQDSAASGVIPGAAAAIAHRAGARHGGVPHQPAGLRSRRAAAQPEAQQGPARQSPVRDRYHAR